MPTLQKLGLVEKVIATPATYKATPIKDGASILLQKRKEEFSELQKKTAALLSGIPKVKQSAVFEEDDDLQFRIVYDRKLLMKKFEKGNKTCKKSIECSGKWPDIKELMTLCKLPR
jgi:sugar-specific transcriptional regulator TrmB